MRSPLAALASFLIFVQTWPVAILVSVCEFASGRALARVSVFATGHADSHATMAEANIVS